ncbi:MAG: NAD-dependent malic enzyme [Candidatus Omnitrophica bacterium CG11_big_fil_rev_8_21_14_0_20_64_10]|nr:MAG: NAD-dependent malic enzyme [Candidatus Omnitrophica bacterium CG11_big_fil_rev_8_21_14_0_20_64_10]
MQPSSFSADRKGRVFTAHLGGKLETRSKIPLNSPEVLRLIYTPGVAEVCRHLKAHPEDGLKYTWLGSTVAVVTNGTAVLSLGNIGPLASLPVMEAKAMLFKELAGLNAVPILIQTREAGTFADTVEQMAPSFGAIMLEDIEAPACFAIERELQKRLTIPVLHADQHATAVVVLAAIMKVASLLQKPHPQLKVLIHGAGPAGLAIARLLHAWGIRELLLCQADGILWPGKKTAEDPIHSDVAAFTNLRQESGRLEELLPGRDVLISTSGDLRLGQNAIRSMARKAVILALSNPQPIVAPQEALTAGCAFALDGTSLNNALAFPGLFKGALEARASHFDEEMLLEAAKAIAQAAPPGQLVPDQLDRKLHRKVARAVAKAVLGSRQEMADCGERLHD